MTSNKAAVAVAPSAPLASAASASSRCWFVGRPSSLGGRTALIPMPFRSLTLGLLPSTNNPCVALSSLGA